MWRLSHSASFSNAWPHLSFLTTTENVTGCLPSHVGGRGDGGLGGLKMGGAASWSKCVERSCRKGCVGDSRSVGGSGGGCRVASGVGF